MSDIQEIHTNDGELKAIRLPLCPVCGSDLKAKHIGNSHTKKQRLQVKCTSSHCRIERTDATIYGGIDDLIRYQEKAWQAARESEPSWTDRLNTCKHHGDDHEACATYSGQVPCDVESEGGEAVAWLIYDDAGNPLQPTSSEAIAELSAARSGRDFPLYTHPAPSVPDEKQAERVARAFWRRIYPYRNDYDKELPWDCPVEFVANMATALCALERPATTPQPADGWKLVPVEPTADMQEAGCQAYMEADGDFIMHKSSMGHAYRAMVSYTPNPPEQGAE